MTLKWTTDRYDKNAPVLTPENANEHIRADADFGAFYLNAGAGRVFKDGTRDFRVYIYIPGAESCQWITLVRVRGHLLDVIKAAERKLFKYYHLPRKYRIPKECIEDTN